MSAAWSAATGALSGAVNDFKAIKNNTFGNF
jgi:hypothetical protein